MAVNVSIICACKQLVEVVNKKVAYHGNCPLGGSRYIAQKRAADAGPAEVLPALAELAGQNFPGGPKINVLAHGPIPPCENGHDRGYGAFVEVLRPDPSNN